MGSGEEPGPQDVETRKQYAIENKKESTVPTKDDDAPKQRKSGNRLVKGHNEGEDYPEARPGPVAKEGRREGDPLPDDNREGDE